MAAVAERYAPKQALPIFAFLDILLLTWFE